MPRRKTEDANETAFRVMQESTSKMVKPIADTPTSSDISRVMAELGRRGGKVGGVKRAASMSPSRRSEIALNAARARWESKSKS